VPRWEPGQHELGAIARSNCPSGSRQANRVKLFTQGFVVFGVNARIGHRALHEVEESILPVFEGTAGALEARVGRGDRRRHLVHVRGSAGERLAIDVGEANVGQRAFEQGERGLDGGRDDVHDAEHAISLGRPGK
jgi:hypothetical protein